MAEYDRVQLKQAARQAMKLQRPHPMLITLLFTIIVNVGSRIVSQIFGAVSGIDAISDLYAQAVLEYGDPAAAVQYVLLSFSPQQLALAVLVGGVAAGVITGLWSGLMRTGYAGFCLDMVRGARPQTDALFSIFPQWAGVLLTQFLAGLFRSLWAALLGVGFFLIMFAAVAVFIEFEVLLGVILLCVCFAFYLGLVWLTLRYAMVDYLIGDQGLTGMDAIRESKRLMRGNTGRLFALRLSFIGWYLLEGVIAAVVTVIGLTAFGAGLSELSDALLIIAGAALGIVVLIAAASIAIGIFNLWLTPYITGSEALFYDWARRVSGEPGRGWGYEPSGDREQPRPPKTPRDDPWN